MATKIRMQRFGSNKRPFYRIVAADSRSPRDGRFIEQLGHFNPLSNDLKIDRENVLKWLGTGAQPSESVKNLFTQVSIMEEFDAVKNGKTFTGSTTRKEVKVSSKAKKAAAKPAAAPAEEATAE